MNESIYYQRVLACGLSCRRRFLAGPHCRSNSHYAFECLLRTLQIDGITRSAIDTAGRSQRFESGELIHSQLVCPRWVTTVILNCWGSVLQAPSPPFFFFLSAGAFYSALSCMEHAHTVAPFLTSLNLSSVKCARTVIVSSWTPRLFLHKTTRPRRGGNILLMTAS